MSLYEKVYEIVEDDIVQIFGPSGSGKSSFCLALILDAVKHGKTVYFIDAERNIRKKEVTNLPKEIKYVYDPTLDGILNYVKYAPKADLLVLDSLGLPVVSKYSEVGMNEKGNMLLKCVTLASYLKVWTWRNSSLAVVTNQPVSEFGKENVKPEDLPPFSDKAKFSFKEIWRSEIIETKPDLTVCSIKAWRSRCFGRGRELFTVRISDEGIKVEVKV